MIKDIYDSLTRFGSRYYLILNKVPGASPNSKYFSEKEAVAAVVDLERDTGSRVVASIPCFCDVSFNRHEFLSAVKQPEHLFSKKLIGLSEAIKDL
jgi:hypothetical protein